MFQRLYRHFGVHHGCFYEIMIILKNECFLKSKALWEFFYQRSWQKFIHLAT